MAFPVAQTVDSWSNQCQDVFDLSWGGGGMLDVLSVFLYNTEV